MKSENAERADEQRGHQPKRPKDQRIFVGISMRGVGEITGKLASRPGVAFAASINDIVPAQMRFRISHWCDVMRTMTVMAFGGPDKAEFGTFAMEGVEVCFSNCPMTFATDIQNLKLELRLVSSLYRMRGMTIKANRKLSSVVGSRIVNAADEFLIDSLVALPTGNSNVSAVNSGRGIGRRQGSVGGMAAGAGCGYDEPAFQQALAMDAFVIVNINVVLGALIDRRSLPGIRMARSAKPWHVNGKGYGVDVFLAQHCVCAMA